jgi:para-nitrobenzyl esterase
VATIRSTALLVAALGSVAAARAGAQQVTVESGALEGSTAAGVESFKGIPFAAPPVGDLRWKAPQPAPHWEGVRRATAYGHDCMQEPFPSDAAPLGTEPAEDCLVLNVWRPAERSSDRLPVMVWIYGGGFVNGGASPAVYDGSNFARQGLVFVSFNYRVGRFGFFAHPALTAESPDGPLGNYGYMDQLAALRWVKANIAAFGGDPENVTVFGESAGGGSVLTLLTTPALEPGAFQRAIVESGGGRGALMGPRMLGEDRPDNPSAETVGLNFARSVGIEGTGPEALAALRALPAERVVAGLNMASMMQQGPPTYPGPMLDGEIVVESPAEALLAGRWQKVPVMIGANDLDIGFGFAQTKDELFAGFGADSAAARRAYDPSGDAELRTLVQAVAADRMMVEPARFVAGAVASQGIPAYEYRFAYVPESLRGQLPGAPHASEIPFVFNTVATKYGASLTAADAATARAANAYWSNFARTGDPNGAGLPDWPAYSPLQDVVMIFTPEGPQAFQDPWKARLDLTERLATGQPQGAAGASSQEHR